MVCFERATNATYKSVVSLTDDRVESFEHIPGVQANFTVDEFDECDQLLRAHPDVIAALAQARHHRPRPGLHRHLDLRRRGRSAEYRDRRLGWSDIWVQGRAGANPYAHPVSGLHFVIDLNTMELLESRTMARSPVDDSPR